MKPCINCCLLTVLVCFLVSEVWLFLLCVSSSPYYLMCMCLDIVQESQCNATTYCTLHAVYKATTIIVVQHKHYFPSFQFLWPQDQSLHSVLHRQPLSQHHLHHLHRLQPAHSHGSAHTDYPQHLLKKISESKHNCIIMHTCHIT